MKRLALTTLAAVSMSVLAACEQQPESSPLSRALEAQRNFEQADGNKDGVVSRNEASTLQNLDFAAADTDGNQALTPEEFEVAMAESTPRG